MMMLQEMDKEPKGLKRGLLPAWYFEDVEDVSSYVKDALRGIKSVKSWDSSLEKGDAYERLLVGALVVAGLEAGRFSQDFRDNSQESKNPEFSERYPKGMLNFTKSHQFDIWVKGGTSGKIYKLETKARKKGVFNYGTAYIGNLEGWTRKLQHEQDKPGYKPTLAVCIMDEFTGEMRFCSAMPQALKAYPVEFPTPHYAKKPEPTIAVPISAFVPFEEFVEYLKTL
jgi:hypothetical protein